MILYINERFFPPNYMITRFFLYKCTQVLGFFTSYLKNDFLKLAKCTAPYYFASTRKEVGPPDWVRKGEKSMRI